MPDLSELIARVEGLEGLDARTMIGVARVVLPQAYPGGWLLDSELSDWRYLKFEKFVEAEAWESAALVLVTRMLPGWGWMMLNEPSHCENGCSYAGLTPPDGSRAPSIALPGKPPALALILALLRALAVKEKDREE